MAANTRQRFVGTPGLSAVLTNTAITTRTVAGVSGLTLVASGSTDGTRVTQICAQALGNTSEALIWFWLYNSLGAGDALLFHEEKVTSITASSTVSAWSRTINLDNLTLPNGYQLLVSSTVANNYSFIPFMGSF